MCVHVFEHYVFCHPNYLQDENCSILLKKVLFVSGPNSSAEYLHNSLISSMKSNYSLYIIIMTTKKPNVLSI